MTQQTKPPFGGGDEGYGYGNYGGYYYGYGGYPGGGAEGQPQRTLKDFLLILRERIWYLIVTFFIIFTGTLLYTFNQTPLFTAVASVQVLREGPEAMPTRTQSYDPSDVRSMEDFNTQLKLLESQTMVRDVARRLKDDELRRFMAPYQDAIRLSGAWTPEQVIASNRNIVPVRMTLMIQVAYRHPDPEMAALVANLFADEFIKFNQRRGIVTATNAVEELKVRADQQRSRVEELEKQLSEYREAVGNISLSERENISNQELFAINSLVTQNKSILDASEFRWNFLQSRIADGEGNLWDIPWIAEQPRINELLSKLSATQIQIATLAKRYREKHPTMIEATRNLEKTREELDDALASAVQKVRADYLNAQQNYQQAVERLTVKKRENMELSRIAVSYNSIERDLVEAENLYRALLSSTNMQMQRVGLIKPSADIIDEAMAPSQPSSPNIAKNLAMGFVGGIVAGLGLIFLVAFLDDRIKTAYDLETIVGLNLIGIIPRIKKLNSPEKAQAVASNSDKRVTEAFRAIHSTLKVNDLSKQAKIILTTSTVPSEGKSFVSTNLAMTYAMHGDKTVIIDADLRMPNIAKSLNLDANKGFLKHLLHGESLEANTFVDVYPNLDVLPAGGRAQNPTQVLNMEAFPAMLNQLREKYDRIIIDTPPIGAVSDALTILPQADGMLYVVKFNTVKRKTAKANLKRLLESNVPIFGAVLNQISASVASYYYANYYDKSYQQYYVQPSESEGMRPKEPVQQV